MKLLLLEALLTFSIMALPNAPSWVTAISPGTWQAVSLNTISNVDPAKEPLVNPQYPGSGPWRGNSGQGSVIDAWNGGAFASGLGQFGSLIVWGGGHQDYYGNEVYAFNLDTRRWSRLSDPYGSLTHPGSISFPVTDGIWPDGSPSCPHTYDQVEYHPATNSFITFRTMQSNTPSNVPVAALFSLTAKTWKRSPRNPSNPVASVGFSVYDSRRGVFWLEGGYGTNAFSQFDPDTVYANGWVGRWTNYAYKLGTGGVAAYDSAEDVIVVTAFGAGPAVYGIDPKSPQSQEVTLKESGTAPSKSSAHGWEWSFRRGAFIYWDGGADVYEFKPPAGDWKTGTWIWNSITNTSNSIAPQPSNNGIYGRFRIARFADAEVAVVVNSVGGPVHAFRIPGGTSSAASVPANRPGHGLSAHPQPFRAGGAFRFLSPGGESLSLKLYDVRGRFVKALWEGMGAEGVVEARWDGRDSHQNFAGAGTYVAVLITKDGSLSQKIVLVP